MFPSPSMWYNCECEGVKLEGVGRWWDETVDGEERKAGKVYEVSSLDVQFPRLLMFLSSSSFKTVSPTRPKEVIVISKP